MMDKKKKLSLEEEKAKEHYARFSEAMGEVERISNVLDQRKDNRKKIREDAKKALREYGLGVARKTKGGNVDKLSAELIEDYIRGGTVMANERAANTFYDNLDSIVQYGIPEKNLEKIIRNEEIVKRASDKQKGVFDAYNSWKGIEDLYTHYNAGKIFNEREDELVKVAAAKELGDEVAKNLSKEGYSADIQDMFRSIVAKSVKVGYLHDEDMKKYALPGLKLMAEELRSAYEETAGKYGKVGDVGREILKGMAKGSREDFEKAIGLVYSASRDEKKAESAKKAYKQAD